LVAFWLYIGCILALYWFMEYKEIFMEKKIINNKDYWDKFYLDFEETKESDFARFCTDKISDLSDFIIIELGCGNGRDSIYFNSLNIPLFSFDLSEVAIDRLQKMRLNNSTFIVCDFKNVNSLSEKLNDVAQNRIRVFYCRFSMHCVNETVENKLLNWLAKNMSKNDNFFIESRTEFDELFGKGVAFDGGFVTSHYRRFINQENFKNKVLKMGFKIEYEVFSKGLAIKGNEDPKLMRFVLRR
jgi:SAM-dependent methyltransferase